MSKLVIMLVLVIVCIAGLAAFGSISNLNAGEAVVDAGLGKKLNEVISNQEKILQKLDDMAKQIQIVKIRATR